VEGTEVGGGRLSSLLPDLSEKQAGNLPTGTRTTEEIRLRGAQMLLAHLCFVAAVLIAYVWVRPLAGWSDGSLLYAASVILLLQLGWSLLSWRLVTGSVFDPYGIFVVAAMVFNAGAAYLYLIHRDTSGLMILDLSFPADVTVRTLLFIFLCMGAFHGGALLLAWTRGAPLFPGPRAVARQSPSAAEIRFVGWAFILVAAVPTVVQLKNAIGVVLTSGYFGLYQVDHATGLQAGTQFFSSFIVPGALVLLAGSRESRRGRLIAGAVIGLYVGIQLFLGARYPAAGALIAYVWLWHRAIRPLPRFLILGTAVVLFGVVFPLIGMTRDKANADAPYPDETQIATSGGGLSPIGVLNETESTTSTIADTMLLVPAQRDYDRGAQYLYAASSLMPNLFWDLHPAVKHGYAGDWVTWIVDPAFAASGGSLGYSFIAEAYLNWGWVGGPLFLGLVGFLLAKLFYWGCATGDPAKLMVAACFLNFVIFWARGEALNVVRPLVWYALVPYLLVLLVAYLNRRQLGPRDLWLRLRRAERAA
jgi:oligosaccharide repeat unit polymerase